MAFFMKDCVYPLRWLFSIAASGFWLGAFAQFPTASELASNMGIGWNLGNSLETPGGETQWGNPPVTPELIAAVKAAGFDTLRIPCAWNSHADPETNVIDPKWLSPGKGNCRFSIG